MSERDPSGKTDGKKISTQQKPPKQASLHEVLEATAKQAAENARLVVGNNGQRRIAEYVRELMSFATRLGTKYGVDPRIIPTQEVRTLNIVYQRQPSAPRRLSPPRPIIRQRPPSHDEQIDQVGKPTPITNQEPRALERSPIETNTYEIELANVLSELPLNRALAILRGKKGLNQKVFGDLVGISKSMVDKMERGLRYIKPAVVHDICTSLEFDETSSIRKILVEKAIEEERIRRSALQLRKRTAEVSGT